MLRLNCSLAVLSAILVTVAFSVPSAEAAIVGVNSNLTKNKGAVYIPLKSGSSGILGAKVTGTRSTLVGGKKDTVTLKGMNTTSSGFVTFILDYDLTSSFTAEQELDPASVNLHLSFDDLDFKTTSMGKYLTYRESLDMTYIRDGSSVPASPNLSLDEDNYGDYRPDGFGATNNQSVVYTFNLQDDLGLSEDDFAALNQDKKFSLQVTLRTDLTHLRKASNHYSNTFESITAPQLTATAKEPNNQPEPCVLALLATGAAALLKRRSRA